VKAALPTAVLDQLIRIITAARKTGALDDDARRRFAIYALPVLGVGWELAARGLMDRATSLSPVHRRRCHGDRAFCD
jgi:hypothetical protein